MTTPTTADILKIFGIEKVHGVFFGTNVPARKATKDAPVPNFEVERDSQNKPLVRQIMEMCGFSPVGTELYGIYASTVPSGMAIGTLLEKLKLQDFKNYVLSRGISMKDSVRAVIGSLLYTQSPMLPQHSEKKGLWLIPTLEEECPKTVYVCNCLWGPKMILWFRNNYRALFAYKMSGIIPDLNSNGNPVTWVDSGPNTLRKWCEANNVNWIGIDPDQNAGANWKNAGITLIPKWLEDYHKWLNPTLDKIIIFIDFAGSLSDHKSILAVIEGIYSLCPNAVIIATVVGVMRRLDTIKSWYLAKGFEIKKIGEKSAHKHGYALIKKIGEKN